MSTESLGSQWQGQKRPLTVVISQPMYFPWLGQLEQLQLADTFVFYDDVQFSKGGFSNRVQIKTASGVRWMTVPLKNLHLGQLIHDVTLDQSRGWQRAHRDSFRQAYAKAPFLNDALTILDTILSSQAENLAELSINSFLALARYFSLDQNKKFLKSSDIDIPGSSTQRVIDICLDQEAKLYLTGHGAYNYLSHTQFEANGIDVSYIKYGNAPYQQQHGAFTPYVTALDLVAHCGQQGRALIGGHAVPWREFVEQQVPVQNKG